MSPSPKKRETVSPARRAALDALAERKEATFSAAALPAGPRFGALEPRERALAERLYRGVLQNLRLIDFIIEETNLTDPKRSQPRIRWLLRMMAYQKIFLGGVPDYAIGEQSVAHARAIGGEPAAKFMNAMVRRMLPMLPSSESELEQRALDPEIRYSVPDDIAAALATSYGAEAMPQLLRAFNAEETRVWLRVNTLKTTPEQLAEKLRDEGVETEPFAGEPAIPQWNPESRAPWNSNAWKRGELTVQDLGAHLAVRLLDPKPGETVIDWCAAPGGKTGQIWEAMGGEGRLLAHEINEQRMIVLRETLARLYGEDHGIELFSAAQTQQLPQADAVLIDAPCMGLGLIRRHPEIRWDRRLERREEMQKLQLSILNEAASRVRPGGRLVWVTCSPTQWENEDVILGSEILQNEFEFRSPLEFIPEWSHEWVQLSENILRTRPDKAPVDGFAMALLTKA